MVMMMICYNIRCMFPVSAIGHAISRDIQNFPYGQACLFCYNKACKWANSASTFWNFLKENTIKNTNLRKHNTGSNLSIWLGLNKMHKSYKICNSECAESKFKHIQAADINKHTLNHTSSYCTSYSSPEVVIQFLNMKVLAVYFKLIPQHFPAVT